MESRGIEPWTSGLASQHYTIWAKWTWAIYWHAHIHFIVNSGVWMTPNILPVSNSSSIGWILPIARTKPTWCLHYPILSFYFCILDLDLGFVKKNLKSQNIFNTKKNDNFDMKASCKIRIISFYYYTEYHFYFFIFWYNFFGKSDCLSVFQKWKKTLKSFNFNIKLEIKWSSRLKNPQPQPQSNFWWKITPYWGWTIWHLKRNE